MASPLSPSSSSSSAEKSDKPLPFGSCTSPANESAPDCTLPSIHQLNPEVDTAFSYKESHSPPKKSSSRCPPTHLLSLHSSADQSDEKIFSRNQSLWSPSHSEFSHSSRANSDSDEERPLQTPSNTVAILGTALRSKEDGTHSKHAYICPYNGCGWSFKRYEHLKRHHLVHTKERPFVCEFPNCGKSFSRSDNYSAHFRTHQRRRSIIETNPQTLVKREDEDLKGTRLIDRRRSLDVGEEIRTNMINPKFRLKHLSVPLPNDVENSLISPSKISNIHQLLNGEEASSSNSYRHKRRYSEHTVVSLQETSVEKPTKISNCGRTERRHSIAVMTSMPNNLGVPSHLSPGFRNSHTLPPNVLRHLYPQSHIQLFSNVHTLSHLPPHSYSHTHPTEQSLPFLSTHAQAVSTPLATIEETPSHYIPTTTTAPRTSSTKNHVCTVSGCNMRFKRLEHLKRHMRVHTLERPFACTYIGCQKTFSRRDNLGQHMRTHERQALKQVQNGSTVTLQATNRSATVGLGVVHAGHIRQKSM